VDQYFDTTFESRKTGMNKLRAVIIAILMVAMSEGSPATAGDGVTTERVSIASNGTQGNYYSYDPSISADGRFVAFESAASNLVPDDTNSLMDVFVRDRQNGTTERVSVASDGTQADGSSYSASISGDGRFVTFQSGASNLFPPDELYETHIYVHDRQSGVTELVSKATNGDLASAGGDNPVISADGRFVAFHSFSSNLVSGDTNNLHDVFVRDRLNGTTERVSIASDGTQANDDSVEPSISGDGRFVVFTTGATNLFSGYNNGKDQVLVRDLLNDTTERVSVSSAGTQGNASSYYPFISADGRYVVFSSRASNLSPEDALGTAEIYLRDMQNGTTERVSLADDEGIAYADSGSPSVSAGGRFVAFSSGSTYLVTGDTNGLADFFIRDRLRGTTELVSLASDGAQGNDAIGDGSISADGHFMVFESISTNLVPSDTNSWADIFVRGYGLPYSLYLPAIVH
jgi:Tol biopolymer transport system component